MKRTVKHRKHSNSIEKYCEKQKAIQLSTVVLCLKDKKER